MFEEGVNKGRLTHTVSLNSFGIDFERMGVH